MINIHLLPVLRPTLHLSISSPKSPGISPMAMLANTPTLPSPCAPTLLLTSARTFLSCLQSTNLTRRVRCAIPGQAKKHQMSATIVLFKGEEEESSRTEIRIFFTLFICV